MSVQVVCISRMLGAGGEAIGRMVADRLGFHYVDEEIIQAASEKARVDPALIASAEHRLPLLSRLMETLGIAPRANPTPLIFTKSLPIGGPSGSVRERERYRSLIREAVAEIAVAGHVVIVAHAASMMLAGTPGVLRVLVTASAATRAERLAPPDVPAHQRRAEIDESDQDRRDYLREFYNVTEELPTHYDLTINTDVLSLETAVAAIMSVARPQAPA